MVATTAKVEPGVSTVELAEEVEHQMRIRGSRTPSFPTHIFTFGREDSRDSTLSSGTEPIRPASPSCSTSAQSIRATAPTSAARSSAASRLPNTSACTT